MPRVLATDENGRILIRDGRAVVREGLAAKAQLAAERLHLRLGGDPFRPLRGVDWDGLKKIRSTAAAAALAASQELERDPLVSSAILRARALGSILSISEQPSEPRNVWAIVGEVRFVDEVDAADLQVEVDIG